MTAAAAAAAETPVTPYRPASVPDRPSPWLTPARAAWPLVVAAALAAVVMFRVGPHVNGYRADQIANCGIAVILAVSLTVVNGFAGQFSIGHSGFMALGGYAAASLVYYGTYRWFGDLGFHGGRLSGGPPGSPWLARGDGLFLLALAFGGLVAAAVGWVVGLPSLRLRGDYLAIVTLAFCEIVRVLFQGTSPQLSVAPPPLSDDFDPGTLYLGQASVPREMTHLGGALGFTSVPTYASLFWITLAAAATVILTVRLKRAAYGRSMLAIREDDVAAAAVGVDPTRYKVRAFVYAAFFAGVGGGLFALRGSGSINAGELGFQRSFDFVIMVVLGGLGSVSGATVAAVFLTLLAEWLRDPPGLWPWGWVAAAASAVLIVVVHRRRSPGPLVALAAVCLGWQGLVSGFHLLQRHGHPDLQLSDYRLVLYALLLILVMIFRPQGLFGVHEVWDHLPARWQFWRARPGGAA